MEDELKPAQKVLGFAELYGSLDGLNWVHIETAKLKDGKYKFQNSRNEGYRYWRVDSPLDGDLSDE